MNRSLTAILAFATITPLAAIGTSAAVADSPRPSATFIVFPSNHPHEDQFDCQNGWVLDRYDPTRNGGAHVTCVRLNHGETRAGYYARRNHNAGR